MSRNHVRFDQPGPDRQQYSSLRSPEPGYQSPERYQTLEQYQPPEEYHRILNQFRNRRNDTQELDLSFGEYHERHPETQGIGALPRSPDFDDHEALVNAISTIDDRITVLENRALEAEYRREFFNAQDTISPFRAPDSDEDMESPASSSDPDQRDIFDHYIDSGTITQLRNLQEDCEVISLRLQTANTRHQILLEEYETLTQHGYHRTSVTYAYREIWVLGQMLYILDEGIQSWDAFMVLRQIELGREVLQGVVDRATANRSYARYANHRDGLYDHLVEAGRHYLGAVWSREFGPGVQGQEMPVRQSALTTIVERVVEFHHNLAEGLGL